MRGVKLAKHLAKHLLEVVVVVDVGQESLVGLAVAVPVDVVQILHVELVLDLSPYVVEHVGTLAIGLVVERGLEVDVLGGAARCVELLDAASA